MREPVDGEEDASTSGRSIETKSINAERTALVKTTLDDEPIESIRSDNT